MNCWNTGVKFTILLLNNKEKGKPVWVLETITSLKVRWEKIPVKQNKCFNLLTMRNLAYEFTNYWTNFQDQTYNIQSRNVLLQSGWIYDSLVKHYLEPFLDMNRSCDRWRQTTKSSSECLFRLRTDQKQSQSLKMSFGQQEYPSFDETFKNSDTTSTHENLSSSQVKQIRYKIRLSEWTAGAEGCV